MTLLALMLLAGAGAVTPDFVDAGALIPAAVIDMRYAGENNFVGKRIDGYRKAKCLLSRPAAAALKAVSEELSTMSLTLRIYDCYRPQRAVDHFMRWAADDDERTKAEFYPRTEKSALFAEGYIAARSGHSRGSTIDLTIDGVDMGGAYDLFDPQSHTANPDLRVGARANRLLLKLVMEKHGFGAYALEWWHFTLRDEPYADSYFDAPVK